MFNKLYYTGTKFLTAKYINANSEWINNHYPKSYKFLTSTTSKHPIIYVVELQQNGILKFSQCTGLLSLSIALNYIVLVHSQTQRGPWFVKC